MHATRGAAAWRLALALLTVGACAARAPDAGPRPAASLVQRLGHPPSARLLVVVVDDVGVNHTTNEVTFRGLASGAFSSAAILVPAPWFAEVARHAREHPEATFGVHFTLTSEWPAMRWGPVSGRTVVPSLVDELGFLPRDRGGVQRRARAEEVEIELRAQIRQALAAGIDVTHVNDHMTALTSIDPRFFEAMLRVARDFRVPVRLDTRVLRRTPALAHIPRVVREMGLVTPDEDLIVPARTPADVPAAWLSTLDQVRPGTVTEIAFDPGAVTGEMEATVDDAPLRAALTDFVLSPRFAQALRERGIERVTYRDLRRLQRGEPQPSR